MFNTNSSKLRYSVLALSLAVSACGMFEGKKKNAGGPSIDTRITEVKSLGGRKFFITYASEQNQASFKCKSDSMSNWIDCPVVGYQYELPQGLNSEVLSVKAVLNGQEDATPANQRLSASETTSGAQSLGSSSGAGSALKYAAMILEKGRLPKTLSSGKLRLSFGLKSGQSDNVKFECKTNNAISFAPCSESTAHTFTSVKKGDQLSLIVRPVSTSTQEIGDADAIGIKVDGSGSNLAVEEIPAPAYSASDVQNNSSSSSQSGSYSSGVQMFGSPLLVGSYQFRVAEDMDVKKYSSTLTQNAQLESFILAKDAVSNIGGTIEQRSTNGSRTLDYKKVILPSSNQAVEFLRSEGLSTNSLVVQTASGTPIDMGYEMIQLSFYQSSEEYQYFTHNFEFLCGVKTGDQIASGVIPNIPLIPQFWHGENPKGVMFRYCTRNITVDTHSVYVMIGTFMNQEQFPCSPYGDNLEIVYMASINATNYKPNFTPDMFAQRAQERILPALSKEPTALNSAR